MAQVTATRYHDICAGHRVVGQGGKCEHLHGHNYRFHFTIQATDPRTHDGKVTGLDNVGRVLDFSVMKSILCQWLEENWDHRMLLWKEDLKAPYILDVDKATVLVPFNPTAENMAQHMVEVVAPTLFAKEGINCELIECRVEETAKCSATFHKY
ncbi:6-pyruvoyl tetrahydropterin synthase [Shewanella phage S0112]|nr:6-pyruvoyl tetrahydropterin synthase [Shewanella phage S0112]